MSAKNGAKKVPGAKRPAKIRGKRPAKVRGKHRAKALAKRPAKQARATRASSQDVELEAAVLRRLLRHFDERKDVQNIELMILAGFCRNCLSRWLVEAAQERGRSLDMERAREKVYGMPYAEWKERHQPPATDEQLARFADAERRGAEKRAGTKS
jgi:hypothetical protein